jgi:hypothetical protein
VSIHYRKLAIAALLGNDIPMTTGQILVDTGVPVRGKDGKMGVMIEEPIEMKMIRDWQQGVFSDTDREISAKYRAATAGFNLEKIKQAINKKIPKPKLRSLQEVIEHVDAYIKTSDPAIQNIHLSNSLDLVSASENLRRVVFNRWMKAKMPPLQQFAPYAFFCYRINFVFMLGVLTDNISTRPTNAIDMEYLYYLPFCSVFVSGDNLHKNMAPFFLRHNQTFIESINLKKDIKLLMEEWNSLTVEQKNDRAVNYGSYPPQDDKFITTRLWKKYMKPWKLRSGNLVSTLTEEQKKKIVSEIQGKLGPYFEQQKKAKNE